ncbi:MAG: rRNA maturation RNase YbeY, partial [Oscillospiraceae bacterium]|nr:rRNA maturation RNase YbeY [Oscillospiraceae bacterium]
MDKVKVLITNSQDKVKIPTGTRLLVRKCCNATLFVENFKGDAEISVTFVDNERIHELNLEHRDKDSATDVLSFPLGENGVYDENPETGAKMLGDIVISLEKALEQSKEYGHSFRREVAFLTVHSMLHLLGYDHEADGLEALKMREREEEILNKLGL